MNVLSNVINRLQITSTNTSFLLDGQADESGAIQYFEQINEIYFRKLNLLRTGTDTSLHETKQMGLFFIANQIDDNNLKKY